MLDGIPRQEKIRLLEQLQAAAGKLSKEEREAQRLIYQAIDLNPDFRKKDEERSQAIVKAVVAKPEDKQRLKTAGTTGSTRRSTRN